MVNILRHATSISRNYGNSCLECLMDHQWSILHPDRWDDNRITAIEYVSHNILIPVLTHPFDTILYLPGPCSDQCKQSLRLYTQRSPPNTYESILNASIR